MNDFNFVTPTPTAPAPPAPLATVSPDAVTRQALNANGDALNAYLRTVAPAIGDVWSDGEPEPHGLSSPAEQEGRTVRYRWTIVAIVLVAAIVATGIAVASYRAMDDKIVAVAAFFLIWGGVALLFVDRAQHHDLTHSAEGVALVAERARAYSTETDADSRQALANAYADAIRTGASSQADVARLTAQQAQQRLDQDLLRLQQQTKRPVRTPDRDLIETCAAPDPTPATTCTETCAPPTVAAIVLAWWLAGVDGGDIQPGRALRTRAPWSLRATDLPAATKTEIWRRLERMEPPLFVVGAGNQLIAGNYSRLAGSAAIRHLLADL